MTGTGGKRPRDGCGRRARRRPGDRHRRQPAYRGPGRDPGRGASTARWPRGPTARILEVAGRRAAIDEAVRLAEPGDVIAVLGKGHERGQEIAGAGAARSTTGSSWPPRSPPGSVTWWASDDRARPWPRWPRRSTGGWWRPTRPPGSPAPVEFDSRKVRPGGAVRRVRRRAGRRARLRRRRHRRRRGRRARHPAGRRRADGRWSTTRSTAMGPLARAVVDRLPELTVIGMTGSSGKTTTKDLIGQLLARLGPTVAPPGSFNNELGHPYTVLQADERDPLPGAGDGCPGPRPHHAPGRGRPAPDRRGAQRRGGAHRRVRLGRGDRRGQGRAGRGAAGRGRRRGRRAQRRRSPGTRRWRPGPPPGWCWSARPTTPRYGPPR